MFSFLLALPLLGLQRVANVTNIEGDVKAIRSSHAERTLALGSAIYVSDVILVSTDAALQIQYLDESILELAQSTKFLVKGFSQTSSHSQLFYGGMRLLSGKIKPNPDRYNIETPNATLGLLGTFMEADFEKGVLSVACTKGQVQIKNATGSVVIGEGMEEYAIVTSYLRRPRIYTAPPPILIRPNIHPRG